MRSHTPFRRNGRVPVRHLSQKLKADPKRVIALPFDLGAHSRVAPIFACVEAMPEPEAARALSAVRKDFSSRHKDFEEDLRANYIAAAMIMGETDGYSETKRLLLGAYFTQEYSIQSAALFNPSIVPHPDQSDAPPGGLRFVMSLRAVGEGHMSSTVFKTGTVHSDLQVKIDPRSTYSTRTRSVPNKEYVKPLFSRRLCEMGVDMVTANIVLDRLGERFSMRECDDAISWAEQEFGELSSLANAIAAIEWLARANYDLYLSEEDRIADLVLFPRSVSESRGIEDMRLVRFAEDDGTMRYFGTYTGFDGHRILPLMMETEDFRRLHIHTLNGACVQNKGMALFPRRLNGHYAMCSRIDGRNLFLMFSDHVHFWESATMLATPKYSWELRLMGNCGSPLETPEGWLLLTHGVGPMRRYCIGAMLLDLENPFEIRGRLREPLIVPLERDREGYVPNVTYSCGGLIHAGQMLLPYAVSDSATRFAAVAVDDLLAQLLTDGP